ncbi:MAG: PilZ domain-containing protein [Candidatus Marinimicrobia bacterium]|nr:PilZ domain-containing protein [Candidatus Neomarinimicrobiota bacterium]
MEKERKYKRWHLSKPLKIIDKKSGKHIGNITDITVAGLGMISKYPLISNITLQLRIDLSNEKFPLDDIELDAKNVWCEENEIVDRYYAGMEFEDISGKMEERIKELIERFGFTT